jgi:DNA helicase II / ATP-dependent DNA helicase PcrA
MVGMEQGRIPRWNAGDVTRREQRRLFYVGLSRAKDEVHMTYSGCTQNQYGRQFVTGPPSFWRKFAINWNKVLCRGLD